MSEKKQVEANRKNSLLSTGPKTPEGVEKCKLNALCHGIRATQPVVPGENAAEWETHRAAIVTDVDPVGALEIALAEQVAAKLWRLGRVVRFESDLIANAQAEDEVLRAHETIHDRGPCPTGPKRTDIPTRDDVTRARHAVSATSKKLADTSAALEELQALASMQDDEVLPSLALYELLREDFHPDKNAVEGLFKKAAMNVFQAHHAKELILICFQGKGDELDQLREILAAHWSSQLDQLRRDIDIRQSEHDNLASRYSEALERRRRASGLPGADDIEKIQRYEAHIERGLHKHLDRLHQLKEARGAVPPRGPAVAVAVVQAPQPAPEQMASFGAFHVEAAEMTEESACLDTQD